MITSSPAKRKIYLPTANTDIHLLFNNNIQRVQLIKKSFLMG